MCVCVCESIYSIYTHLHLILLTFEFLRSHYRKVFWLVNLVLFQLFTEVQILICTLKLWEVEALFGSMPPSPFSHLSCMYQDM